MQRKTQSFKSQCREQLIDLLHLDPRDALIRELRENRDRQAYLGAVATLTESYPLPQAIVAQIFKGSPQTLDSTQRLLLVLLRVIFAQACHWKKFHETYQKASKQMGRELSSRRFSPEELDSLVRALTEQEVAVKPVVDELVSALDEGREPRAESTALKTYDKRSIKVAKELAPKIDGERARDLDPRYNWATDPQSKKQLRKALGIDKGHWHALLKRHGPSYTARNVVNIPFRSAILLLDSRLQTCSKKRVLAFAKALLASNTLLGSDMDRIRQIQEMVRRRLNDSQILIVQS